jgi:PIN domain nuclease of toxin-antitoxin system
VARADALAAVVVDTHPLVWYACDQRRRLSPLAKKVFERFERGQCSLFVPAPVLLELWFLSLNGTIETAPSLGRWWRAMARDTLVEVPMEHEDVLGAAALAWAHRDPHDRLIAATAQRLDFPLLTADAALRAWGGVEIVW